MRGIAIIGMACRYAGARSPQELWENALAERRSFRSIPTERLNHDDYWDSDRNACDKTYCDVAAVIEDYEFDRVRYRVSGEAFRAADISHWLALDIAAQALDDAGLPGGTGLPRETTGVFVGNTLTGEFSRASTLRLRWPYVRRMVASLLSERENAISDLAGFLAELEERFKAPFPPPGDESLAGGLSNTIAGRISNHLDLKGGCYVVDGACASSLLAVVNACAALEAGAIDVAIAGGVDVSIDPFELAGFARLGALARDEARVFDAHPTGFWPGEGCGMLVLVRAGDVASLNARAHALIRGWGIASDGSGGITRPEVEGQRLALRRAYRKAGLTIADVGYFEAHGTGTEVGDVAEISALIAEIREARQQRAPRERQRAAVIGSVKAIVGHTKAAAGVAGLIRAAMVVRNGVLPPTTACKQPHPLLENNRDVLRPATRAEAVPGRLRAGVSAMGFGGIDAHVVVESATRPSLDDQARLQRLSRSGQDAEVFFFGGADAQHVTAELEHLANFAAHASFMDLVDAAISRPAPARAELRCAVVASAPWDLKAKLESILGILRSGGRTHIVPPAGCFIGSGPARSKVGFLFPGQAAPYYSDGGAWAKGWPFVDRLYRRERLPHVSGVAGTDVAQVGVCLAEIAALRMLAELGIEGSVAIGHSLGEIVAWHWAGALNENDLLRLIRTRGAAMQQLCPEGRMLSIAGAASDFTATDGVVIAALNSQSQTILAGSEDAIRACETRLRRNGRSSVRLPVTRAFHSQSMQPCLQPLTGAVGECRWMPLRERVFSTITGSELAPGADLGSLILRQVTSPVQFESSLRAADADVDLWVEMGPGGILTGLARELSGKPVLSLDAGGASISGLLGCAAALYARGVNINTAVLFRERFHRERPLYRRPVFFANPCESAPKADVAPNLPLGNKSPQAEPEASVPLTNVASALDELAHLIAARTELPPSSIASVSRMLSDLHLNSIVVGRIVVEACRRMGIATPSLAQYSDATLGDIAQSLDFLKTAGDGDCAWERWPSGIGQWVRTFYPVTVEAAAPVSLPNPDAAGDWKILAARRGPWLEALERELRATGTAGVVVYLPDAPATKDLPVLLAGARAVVSGSKRFALISKHSGAASFARAVHAEFPEIGICVIQTDQEGPESAKQVATEIASAGLGYLEVHYDSAGVRRRPVLKLFRPDGKADFALTSCDVIAVTGGAKGITSECALALARESGAKLLIIGRSDPGRDTPVLANLERMRQDGITVHYERADLTDCRSTQQALSSGQHTIGAITAILHGAAINEPRLLRDLDESAFAATIAPKVDALQHIMAAVDESSLRLVVAFGSVISRTGLAGEAHYGFANELLAQQVESWADAHPKCKAFTVEWSIWAGSGMGERLGRVDDLLRQGISPIPIESGVEVLKTLIASRLPARTIVAAGRLGASASRLLEIPELPFRRFLEEPRVYYPGIELVADCAVSPVSDPYLDDHAFQGQRLLPGVMALEAMAQAAAALDSSPGSLVFENVDFREALRIPDQQCTLRVAAVVDEQASIELAVRSSETAFHVDHVRAVAKRVACSPRYATFDPGASNLPNLSVDTDLYGDLFFQSGRLRRVSGYRRLRAFECVAELRAEPGRSSPEQKTERWYSPYLPSESELGDAGWRDAALHSIQAVIPHRRLLPVGVERITFLRPATTAIVLAHAVERSHDRDRFIFDLEIASEDMELIEVWEGLRLQAVEKLRTGRSMAEPLMAALLERELADLCGVGSRISIELQSAQRRFRDLSAGNGRRPDGKPDGRNGLDLRSAYTGGMHIGICGDDGADILSCDAEEIEHRESAIWESLLPPGGWMLANRIAIETGEERDTAATRVWTANEAFEKLGMAQPAGWCLENSFDDGRVTFRAGAVAVLTIAARVRQCRPAVIAVAAIERRKRMEDRQLANV